MATPLVFKAFDLWQKLSGAFPIAWCPKTKKLVEIKLKSNYRLIRWFFMAVVGLPAALANCLFLGLLNVLIESSPLTVFRMGLTVMFAMFIYFTWSAAINILINSSDTVYGFNQMLKFENQLYSRKFSIFILKVKH